MKVHFFFSQPKKGKDHDDDMFESDEEDTHDAYLVRMKAEGKEREEEEDDESDDSSGKLLCLRDA